MLDEATDYKYDISEWLEDCLDEIDMREEYEVPFSRNQNVCWRLHLIWMKKRLQRKLRKH